MSDDNDPNEELRAQLPKRAPKPPTSDKGPPEDMYYPDGPPKPIPVSLDKNKYMDRDEAMARALELCELRGLKFMRMFETARYYVAECFRPSEGAA